MTRVHGVHCDDNELIRGQQQHLLGTREYSYRNDLRATQYLVPGIVGTCYLIPGTVPRTIKVCFIIVGTIYSRDSATVVSRRTVHSCCAFVNMTSVIAYMSASPWRGLTVAVQYRTQQSRADSEVCGESGI